MPRTKAAVIESIANGTVIESEDTAESEDLEEMDLQEKQDEIISPTSAKIELIGVKEGELKEEIWLPYDLSINQLFRQKIMNNLRFTYMLIQSELRHIRSGPIDPSDILCIGILYKDTVQSAIFSLMGIVLNRPASDFENRLDDKNTIAVFQWLIQTITTTMGTGNSNSKKTPK